MPVAEHGTSRQRNRIRTIRGCATRPEITCASVDRGLIISAMNNEQKQFRRRLAVLGAISLLGFAALAGRVVWLQALQ